MTKRVRKDLTQTVREDLSDEVILWTELNEVKIRQVVSDRNQGATSVKTTGPVRVWHILRETESMPVRLGAQQTKVRELRNEGQRWNLRSSQGPGQRGPADQGTYAGEPLRLFSRDWCTLIVLQKIPWTPCGELKWKATSRLLQQSH